MSCEIICSIIIPTYNAEKTIIKTLNCFKNLSRYSFEVLIINDGSNDDTEKICRDYCEKDERFRLINKKNGGVSSARNVGIDNANGKYIFFADSDDEILLSGFVKMIEKAEEFVSELVIANYFAYNRLQNEKVLFSHCIPCDILLDKNYIDKEIMKRYFVGENIGLANLWNKLFCTDIIKYNNIRFDERRTHGEDWAFNIKYFQFIKSFIAIKESIYIYNLDGSQKYDKYIKKLGWGLIDGYNIKSEINSHYCFFSEDSFEFRKVSVNFVYQIIDFLKLKQCDLKEKRSFLKHKIVRQGLKRVLKIQNTELYRYGLSKRSKLSVLLLLMGSIKLGIKIFEG